MPDYNTLKFSKQDTRKAMATICGLVTSARKIPTKKDPTKFVMIGTIEDLTDKIEVVGFGNTVSEYGDFLVPENKVIISGKVQQKEDNENVTTSLIIDSIKPVENTNLVTISLNEDFKFEELCNIKDVLASHHGSDPVMFKLHDSEDKLLTGSTFWVDAKNDLAQVLNNIYKDRLSVNIKSMDETNTLDQPVNV